MVARAGEKDCVRFRTSRFFVVDDKYFAQTREGNSLGPFKTKADAEHALKLYLRGMNDGLDYEVAVSRASQGEWAANLFQ